MLGFGKYILIWAFFLTSLSAHVVEQIYSEWSETEGAWQLKVEFDVGYADPDTRDDPYEPAPTREWLVSQSEETWAELREQATLYLEEMILIESNGRALELEAEFPDWAQSPPDFPSLLNGVGYFRVVFSGEKIGRIKVGVKEGSYPNLIVRKGERFLVLKPGVKKQLREGGRWWVWVREGYRHVVPLGWDHVLFVFGLFFYRRRLMELFHQSLAFTFAHSLTLGLAAAGWLVLPANWGGLLEVLIALSLVLVGVENLRSERKLLRRLIFVFLLGLLHGLGFAGALANYVDGEQLLSSVAGLNIGVELAQISLLAIAWLVTMKWNEKPCYEKVRWAGSLLVAIAGMLWAVTRLWDLLA